MFTFSMCLSSLLIVASAFKDYGIHDWTCTEHVMKRSAAVPDSVHSLRFADIEVIAAIGDSLTAGNGAGAADHKDLQAVPIQNRGLVFSVGGDQNLDQHVTLANILKKFNPNLFGFSIGSGPANGTNARLNAAVPGAKSVDLPGQAIDLVKRFHGQFNQTDIEKSWKLVHIFIGGNDVCAWCKNPQGESANHFGHNIANAVKILKDNLPRTIVVITGMIDITVLREVGAMNPQCAEAYKDLCPCIGSDKFTTEQLRGVCKEYMKEEDDLQYSGIFDSSDDFTVVVQPFFEDNKHAPLLPDGTVDISLFAPDCFHFSAYGHAIVAKNLWNNLLQPVGAKTKSADLTDAGSGLHCPDPSCPFIRTTKNSADCWKYLTNAL